MSSRDRCPGDLRRARVVAWFMNVPLAAFVAQSFRAAQALYLDRCEHPSAGRFTAGLVSLILWTAFLTLNMFAVLKSRREGTSHAP